MDALDTVFQSVRLSSSALFRACYGDPWCVSTRKTGFPLIHAIVEGRCQLLRKDEPPLELTEGDVVVLPHGTAHSMGSNERIKPVSIGPLLERVEPGAQSMEYGGPGATCKIICGTFEFDHDAAQWLLRLMPTQLHLRPTEPALRDWVSSTLSYLETELQRGGSASRTVVARLIDMLVLQAARHEVEGSEDCEGWIAALRDERVGKALALIHSEPQTDWTMQKLASASGMSRSRFFDRFSSLVGEPPARYLARWRTSAAADMIRREDVSTAEAAQAVGYTSEQAFTAAFRRHLGLSPSAFRRQLRA